MEVILKDVNFYDDEIENDKNIYLSLRNIRKERSLHKFVDGVTLRLQPGSVTALIGSPLETRILLELIGLRQRNGFIIGSIYHDNSIRKNGSCYRDIAYVKDFDSNFFGHLTVESFLSWAAQLRLSLSEAECNSRAREAAKLLNLEGHIRIKELQKGERILLAVASELVENPTLVCVESPIDNMEESFANDVVKAFSAISHRQNTSTTIVFTAISTSNSSFDHIDHVSLFFNAKLLYSSGELFDYKNLHLGDMSTAFGMGFSDSRRKVEADGDMSENQKAFLSALSECRDIICTIFRDISRSGYGTSYFSSQFLSSDHRIRAKTEGNDPETTRILLDKRVDAIEQRIFQHLASIAEISQNFEDQNAVDDDSAT